MFRFGKNTPAGESFPQGGADEAPSQGPEWGKVLPGELLKKWPRGDDGKPVRPVFLQHCSSVSMDDELTLSLLDSYDIPCIREYPENGVIGRVVLGMSGYGTDIFVPETMLEDALALLKGEPEGGD